MTMNTENLRSASRDILSKFKENKEWVASDGTKSASHLVVLVPGLWGNPTHLEFLAASLRDRYSEDSLHILLAKTNSDTLTYDGVDLGGERVADEIERYIAYLQREPGRDVDKISLVGYSLGGLVARYAIGVLHTKKFFENVRPLNFTTFATPHLGVATPLVSFRSRIWNYLGALTLSTSGQQLFAADTFRDAGKPLLCLLSDPQSIFMGALKMFPNRVLYANIVNDRSVPFYTGAISSSDPFADLSKLKINYLAGYDPVVLEMGSPFDIVHEEGQQSLLSRFVAGAQSLLSNAPWFAALTLMFTIGVPLFLCNAVIQSIRSRRRIKLYETSRATAGLTYQSIFKLEDLEAEGVLNDGKLLPDADTQVKDSAPASPESHERLHNETWQLRLSVEQQSIVSNLDGLFKKFFVHIHKARHSHAAIIVRRTPASGSSFSEGKVVIDHWLTNAFNVV